MGHSHVQVVCLLDFEKAYDRVQHNWLFACLEAAGLPKVFQAFLRTTLQGATIKIMANGTLSQPLPVTSGVRQGDPLSPLLFNLALEPMLLALEKEHIKAQAHADDTALALNSVSAAKKALQIITCYEAESGMLLNRNKSVALASAGNIICTAAGFRACPNGDRYLGVHLAPGGDISILPGTWEALAAKVSRLTKMPISLWGRMTLLR